MTEALKIPFRVAVGVSGSGRSLKNLIDRQARDGFEIAYVFCSSPDAPALDIAKNAKISAGVFDFKLTTTAARLYQKIDDLKIDLIVLAGFLKVMPTHPAWQNKIINIHPSLLPRFGGKGMYGKKVHEAVLGSKESLSGATIHFVNERYDEGRIVARVAVPVFEEDSPEALSARVFAAECELLPWAIRQMAAGSLNCLSEMESFKWQDGRLLTL
jgi:phosphoribosylglycinamide formyltransferase-1